jgi:phage baseplate assembly protein W
MAQTLNKLYSDIDFTFTRVPVTGDVAVSYDFQAVTRSVRNLLQTNNYDRPFNPDLGSQLNALLFEPMNPLTENSIENEIAQMIAAYEPRVILQKVNVEANDAQNAYNVTISFFLQNATTPTTITILLERNR